MNYAPWGAARQIVVLAGPCSAGLGALATNTVAWGMRPRSGARRLKCMPNGLPTLEHLAECRGAAAQPPSSRPSQEQDHDHG
jgi:hypothetical protein